MNQSEKKIRDLEKQLAEANAEIQSLRAERAGLSRQAEGLSAQSGTPFFIPDLSGRVQTHQQLQAEHELFRTLIKSIDDEVWFCDLQGNFTLLNDPTKAGLGLEHVDGPVQPLKEAVLDRLVILNPDGKPRPDEQTPLLRSLEGETVRGEEIVVNPCSGDRMYRHFTSAPVRFDNGEIGGAVAIVRDITELKRAEEALQKSEERFRSTFENATVGISHVSLEGKWLRLNDRLCQIAGYTREELLEITFFDISHPEDIDEDWRLAKKLQRGEIPGYQLEKRYIHKDGHLVWVLLTVALQRDRNGNPLYFISVVQDISERKKIERQLLASEARLRIALESSGVMVFNQDRDLRYTWMYNPAVGLSVDDFLGKTDAQIFPPGEAGQLTAIKQEVLRTGEKARAEVKTTIKESVYHYQMSVEPVYDHQGRVTGVLGSAVDITHRKNMEDRLRKVNENLERRVHQRIQDLGVLNQELEAEIAERIQVQAELVETQRRLMDSVEAERMQLARELHDGPMQDLYGTIYRAAAINLSNQSPEEAQQEVEAIKTRLTEVNKSLRAISQNLRPPTLSEHGLEKAIREHVHRTREKDSGPEIGLDLMEDGGSLPEDMRLALYRIYQVAMTNCLLHAAASKIDVRLQIDSEQVVLEIEDDGQGFELPERWTQFARQGHLGLLGAHERAQAVSGDLEVRSSPGKGTLIKVSAPRIDPAAAKV